MDNHKSLNYAFSIFLIVIIPFTVNAQKLPNVQQSSLRAPANVKIDGKATEWNNQFQAYNSKDDAYYTIANDDDKLYLIIQGKDKDAINKMIRSGVTFTINSSGKKNDKEGASITFPVTDRQSFNVNLGNKPKITRDSVFNRKQTDSFRYVVNTELAKKSKYIVIAGIKAITGDSISVYNEYGIKAVALVDAQINYIYELAVPLKYLGLSVNDVKHFFYNIKINALPNFDSSQSDIQKGITSFSVDGGSIVITGPSADRAMFLLNSTDFWGEYTLAKK